MESVDSAEYGYVQCVQANFHMNEQYFVQNVLRLGDAYKGGRDMTNCKSVCSKYTTGRPYREPYATHYYCSRCAYWGDKKDLTELCRCPCCNFRPRTRRMKNKHWKENNPDKNKHGT